MNFFKRSVFLLGLVLASPSSALELDLPGNAELTQEIDAEAETYFLPSAPLADGRVPTQEIEGRVVRQAWRITQTEPSTLALVSSIRAQMQAQGYDVILDCTTEECGGFDFRFAIDVLPAPDMFVDLFDFRFLSAQNPAVSGAEYVTVLVSRAGQVGYIQLVLVAEQDRIALPVPTSEPDGVQETGPVPDEPVAAEEASDATDVAQTIVAQGYVILSDLIFATGSSTLEDGSYDSLAGLAAFLNADSRRRVVLVGHTDAVGALDGNITLSKARAGSVLQRLARAYDVAEEQLSSEGMGYLSPVASNTTAEGRRANRRVEAVLLSAE